MAMKESGIEWVGLIPDTWSVIPNKYVMHKEKNLCEKWSGEDVMSLTVNGVIVRDLQNPTGKMPATFDGYQYVENGDLLMCLFDIDVTPRCVGRVTHDGVTSPAYSNFKVHDNASRDYFYYYYLMVDNTKELLHLAKNLRHSFTEEQLGQLKVPMPPLSEQQAIADYLDETCSKIDEIIAEAKASIDEYEKLKQATIDENILGYDSVHIKLRQLGSLKNGLNFLHSDDVANIKFLGVGCFKDNMILREVDDFTDEHIDFEISEEYLLSNGDIVFVRSNGSKELVGRSLMVENIDYPVTFSGFCIRFRNMHTELVDNRFLIYYFRTTHFKQLLLKYSNDSTNINNLNQEMLNAIRINAPVIGEQKLLVKKLEEQVLLIDSLITEKESLINDLEAYKKSLIYEVVTGKRRVV